METQYCNNLALFDIFYQMFPQEGGVAALL